MSLNLFVTKIGIKGDSLPLENHSSSTISRVPAYECLKHHLNVLYINPPLVSPITLGFLIASTSI